MKIEAALFGLAAWVGASVAAQAAPVSTIWVDNATGGAPILQEYNISTGALVDQITAPHGDNGRGVVTVGNILYYTDASDNHVYAYNFATNTDLGTAFTVAGASALSTLAYDGTNFWVGDYSGTNHAYLYSPTGTLLKTVSLANCRGNCDGLEYGTGVAGINAGKPFLISNRYDGGFGGANSYDVYDTNGNLLTSALITGRDGRGNTGIAFDGTDFYIDNLFSSTIDVFDTTGAYVRTISLTGQTYFLGEDLSVNYSAVLPSPEPASLSLLGAALAGLGLLRRKRRQS